MPDQLVYRFDRTLDGLLTAVFDAFARREQPVSLIGEQDVLPMFCDAEHHVLTDEQKAARVWADLEKRLPHEAVRMLAVSYLSELQELDDPLFRYVCKVFRQQVGEPSPERNFADPDVLAVTRIAQRVMHERLRMMQFVRFQKTQDDTYLAVIAPDHNVLPIVIDHFADRFRTQRWLLYDARRRYGYYYDFQSCTRITFDTDAPLAFDPKNGRLHADVMSADERLLQDMWQTYFKAVCIRERMNPRKQLADMPRRYRRYMTEVQQL
ncbi:MAG: TIGR03915 family putative DNA repair protein [Paludibacteraceae bacterium]|nr:TIGR03915 family putative DNA repair protein [Paludibacteraceae bacterium]